MTKRARNDKLRDPLVMRVRFENTILQSHGPLRHVPGLKIDHQTFLLALGEQGLTKAEANWTRDQLAIALARLIETHRDEGGTLISPGRAAAFLGREHDDPKLYDIAREVTHGAGLPWTDPRTGKTHPPPKARKTKRRKVTTRQPAAC